MNEWSNETHLTDGKVHTDGCVRKREWMTEQVVDMMAKWMVGKTDEWMDESMDG